MLPADRDGEAGRAIEAPPYRLGGDDPAGLTAYLRRRGWIAGDETVQSVGAAGDGNMNCTLRVVTTRQRLVVKQGRPWVEKYPDIPAPPDRTLVEAAFYDRTASTIEVAGRMPRLVGVDRASRVLALEDCDGFTDLTGVYEGGTLHDDVAAALLAYLVALHRVPVDEPAAPPFANPAMLALNHAHLFALPLAGDAGLEARLERHTPGLAADARALAGDRAYVDAVAALGRLYLHGPPRALVHGDYFPGSWLARGDAVKVIDPEFCFAGSPEFDYGIMAAHLIMADQDRGVIRLAASAAATAGANPALVAGFAGVEIMRRLIGVAQLPRLARSLEVKRALLERSRRLILGGSLEA